MSSAVDKNSVLARYPGAYCMVLYNPTRYRVVLGFKEKGKRKYGTGSWYSTVDGAWAAVGNMVRKSGTQG